MTTLSTTPSLGRALLAGAGWAIVWPLAAIVLSFELARLTTPEALQSRFFYMWTFTRSAAWFVPAFATGATFVLVEERVRGARSRATSRAGWRALLLGGILGLAVGLVLFGISVLGENNGRAFDPLTFIFCATLGATCGLGTFLLERLILKLHCRWKRPAP